MVELPPAETGFGLKLTDIPPPRPEAESEIGEANPPVTDVVMVVVPELLRAMLSDEGDAPSVKPVFTPVTVRVTVVVSCVLPEVPVTVMV